MAGKKGGEQAGGCLELAWHCIRAGRQEQAIPHLMFGAREALESGAPHETELALRSALPALPESVAADARLLIVEAIQEQGRYQESLSDLHAVVDTEVTRERLLVLRTAANVYEWSMTATELRDSTVVMVGLVNTAKDPLTRLRAAQVAGVALNELRDQEAAHALLVAVNALPSSEYSEQEWMNWALVKTQACLIAGTRVAGIEEMPTLLSRAQSPQIVNSTSVRLMMATGALWAVSGDYDRAILHHHQAFAMALRLGRGSTAASSASNLAICYLRLGIFEAAGVGRYVATARRDVPQPC